ncbi:MAG: MarR family transcriptional regulator [Leptolyngbyaceae cyanobacterium RU_5_1]|nr:MarR family transcriptional regulator [Leptolyngbyaceae cyanobacterium RU_5_1]
MAANTTSVLIIKLAEKLTHQFNERLTRFEIQPKHFRILFLLTHWGPLSQVELGQHTKTDRAPMVHLIDHLERLGLVERTLNPSDRRVKTINLTDRGRDVAEQTLQLAHAVEAEVLAPLSDEESRQLNTLLSGLMPEHFSPELRT